MQGLEALVSITDERKADSMFHKQLGAIKEHDFICAVLYCGEIELDSHYDMMAITEYLASIERGDVALMLKDQPLVEAMDRLRNLNVTRTFGNSTVTSYLCNVIRYTFDTFIAYSYCAYDTADVLEWLDSKGVLSNGNH